MAAKRAPKNEFGVDFGNVSVGDETASITFKTPRPGMTLPQADKTFCGRRLKVLLSKAPPRDDQGQLFETDDTPEPLEVIADVKRFGVSRKTIGATLNFSLGGPPKLDLERLVKFAKCTGSVRIVENIDIPEGKAKDPEATDAEE